MNSIVSAFQLEVRYNPILNFNSIGRGLISPFVRLSKNIRIDRDQNQEESIVLEFDNNFEIVTQWDRLILRGQGKLEKFKKQNSDFDSIFLVILDKLKEKEEFGSITNYLFAVITVKEMGQLPEVKDEVAKVFSDKLLSQEFVSKFDGTTDLAIKLSRDDVDKGLLDVQIGPYFGPQDIATRTPRPIDISSLGNLEFTGVMTDYKRVNSTNKFTFEDFKVCCEEYEKTIEPLWKII